MHTHAHCHMYTHIRHIHNVHTRPHSCTLTIMCAHSRMSHSCALHMQTLAHVYTHTHTFTCAYASHVRAQHTGQGCAPCPRNQCLHGREPCCLRSVTAPELSSVCCLHLWKEKVELDDLERVSQVLSSMVLRFNRLHYKIM